MKRLTVEVMVHCICWKPAASSA